MTYTQKKTKKEKNLKDVTRRNLKNDNDNSNNDNNNK